MDIWKSCSDLSAESVDLVVITVLRASAGTPGKAGFKMIVTRDGTLLGTVGGGAVERHAVEKAREILGSGENVFEELDLAGIGMQCGGTVILTYEYVGGRERFILFGGGHVGSALLPILESLGFLVTVYDNRKEIIGRIVPSSGRTLIHGPYEDIGSVLDDVRKSRYAFIGTHGHLHDYDVLSQLIRSEIPFTYVGLIGSKSKIRGTCGRLVSEGLPVPDYLYGPVGLSIGGDTAQEIAVSIAAEVVAVKNGAAVPHMRTTVER